MSAEKPEVGDVWDIGRGIKFFVTATNQRIDAVDGFTDNGVAFYIEDKEYFAKENKYLGKSKTNINQLFEVE